MSHMLLEESNERMETNPEEKDASEILKNLNKTIKINLYDNINIFFDENLKYISLSPILPVNKIDFLILLYNLKITKEEILSRIKYILGEKKIQNIYKQNEVKIQKINNQIKIIDEHFIKDCLFISKEKKDGILIVSDKISKTLFGCAINYSYRLDEKQNKKRCVANLKVKDNIYIESDLFVNEFDAKFNVNKKIIMKYFEEKIGEQIINNIDECLKRYEIIRSEKRSKYQKYLDEIGGDRKLLKNKRKISQKDFFRRLPYFNMLDKDKEKKKKENSLYDEMDDDDDEEYFMNTEILPINEILLGDQGIVDNHINDFKYTPLKIYEMIRDSEKMRGVDFKMEYSQINNKNYCINNEVTIFSQKLGIKVQGYGKSREEAENKCALNLITVIFKSKFRTYCELHEYFENKNGKYLDIILKDENDNTDKNKIKKIEENINTTPDRNIYNNINYENNNDDNMSVNSLSDDENESLENYSYVNDNKNNINNNPINKNFFNNSKNNSNTISVINNSSISNNNSITNNKIIEELTKTKINKNAPENQSSCDENKNDNDNDNDEIDFDENLFYLK